LPTQNNDFYPADSNSHLCTSVVDNINHISIKSNFSNDSKYTKVIKYLRKKLYNNKLKILKVDKGNILIILPQSSYDSFVTKHLNDKEAYEIINNKNVDCLTLSKIQRVLKHNEVLFTKSELNFLIKKQFNTSYFYVLPKLHKSVVFSNINLSNQPLYAKFSPDDIDFDSRPIISCVNNVTSGISRFLHIILSQFLSFVKTFIKDSFHLLDKIKSLDPSQFSFFATFDVKSLYTNLNNEVGKVAIDYYLNKFYDRVAINNYPKELLISLLTIVIENNYFINNGTFYRQKKGCAMGSIMSPTYAILYLGFLEDCLYDDLINCFGIEKTKKIFDCFYRFIDDILIIWPFSQDDFECFVSLLKKAYGSLQIVSCVHSSTIVFLDIKISYFNNSFDTDIHYKPTNNFSFVPFDSFHPGHVKRNVPYILFYRICSIVSSKETCALRINEISNHLLKLKYPKELINDAIKKALLKNKKITSNKNNNLIPFVIKFNPANAPIINSIKNHYKVLQTMTSTEHIFKNTKMQVAYQNNNNIIRHLSLPVFKVVKCNISRCGTCDMLITGTSFQINNHSFFPNKVINCRSQNVIYIIVCENCSLWYIGETENQLRFRVTLHRQHCTTDYGFLKVNIHIKECCKNTNKLFKIFPFYQNNNMSLKIRKLIEKNFIRR